MKKFLKYTFLTGISLTLLSIVFGTSAKNSPDKSFSSLDATGNDTLPNDTSKKESGPIKLKYPFRDESGGDPLYYPDKGGLQLNDPSNITTDIEYDPRTGQYSISKRLGKTNYRPPTYMDFEEYSDYEFNKSVKDYWKQRTSAEKINQSRAIIPKLHVGGEMFDRIFGGNTVDIRPQGSAELTFGVNTSKTENPALPVKQQKISTFDFNEKIQLNVIGKIGDKLKLTTNYNTEATFDFENQMKLEYNGYEDEIIKKIEAGNVSLPLTGSLITGSQSLFGIKTQLQFGRLTATSIFSQQKGKKSEIEVTGGAQTSKFEISADSYEANKHYFLAHYFRDQYNTALANLPLINSGINITKIEVWVTNTAKSTENTRNIVAFSDLGEDADHTAGSVFDSLGVLPFNGANNLYSEVTTKYIPRPRNFNQVTSKLALSPFHNEIDFEKRENAKKLSSSEYTFNAKLGFISLNAALNYDEVLAVAFQYTLNGKTYQVGEFSTDGLTGQEPLIVKMLKNANVSTALPMWDLMMKNVYSIGAYQVNRQDFKLDIWYNNASTGTEIKYIPEGVISGKPLIQVMNMDRLNTQLDPNPDGFFDFLDGVTINASNGRVYFSVLEPFGSHLRTKIENNTPANAAIADKYVFQQLYDSTKTSALQFPEKNRYKLKGTYQSSSSSEISLNAMNVPQGSVTVTAGGAPLAENVDYTVDYNLGRVKIINEGILKSGTPIKIALESNSLFSIQSKTLLGTHLDYYVNKDVSIGGTILNLTERPFTQKTNIGEEPISNTIWGLDGKYRADAPFITRWIDKIPLIQTKELSTLTFVGEFAHLIPGHSRAIGKNGNAYIDDFEGSQSAIDIKSVSTWSLASVPQGQPNLFPEGELNDSLPYGFNRAALAWYVLDPLFLRQTSGLTPTHIGKAEMSNHFVREILETEIFPNKQSPSGQPINIPVLDLAYYPNERGPYNYDITGLSGISGGIDSAGFLKNPETRWGGIMRKIETNDFEAANVEFIQFWMMDPFNDDNTNPNTSGELYFNLGNVSEDILKDSRKSFENGLPASASSNVSYDETKWGRVPSIQSIVNTFDNDPTSRPFQDVGFDGMKDDTEELFFSTYLQQISGLYGNSSQAYIKATIDPSGDNYHYYRGGDYDSQSKSILERYKMYNGVDGNSPTSGQPNAAGYSETYPTSATTMPNAEDINKDNTLSESESYYQYKIKLTPNDIQPNNIGNNYITDVFKTHVTTKDGRSRPVTWYQFKIPVKNFETKVGNIEDFKSIRFIRMFFKDVDKPVICRFSKLELIRGEWRKYNFSLLSPGDYNPDDNSNTSFDVSAVNFEENGSKKPVNYVLPPGIAREVSIQTANLTKQNEQSMSLKICELQDGDARAAYKNADLDVRSYKKLQMYVHADAANQIGALNNGDLTIFVRLGTDYTDNYYEYEIPLQITPEGSYNNDDEKQQQAVWPESNKLELSFEALQAAKQKRNTDYPSDLSERPFPDGKNTIRIKGNPNLSTIKTIMIGVRNPKRMGNNATDDGFSKCAEIWINELRLTDFDEKGGWAANARVTSKLADLGTLTLAGNRSTPGFGSIEKKVSERSRETIEQYDISSSLELGKFIPKDLNIRVPVYVGYSEAWSTPQYNPLDPDIKLKPLTNKIESPLSDSARIKLKNETVDYSMRKSINFTNVKKEKGKNAKKSHVYDIENVAVSYAYSESFKRNITIEYNTLKNYRGGLTYNYSANPKNIKPFAKSKLLGKSPYFALIKDFNFYLLPGRYGFTTDIDRQYNEVQIRKLPDSDVEIDPTFNKTFTMMRTYDLKYDLTKSLKLDFSASNDARIMEPEGRIDTKEKKDTVIRNIRELGKTTHYRHTVNANYTIPINKIPLFDFASATARYSANYDWMRAPFSADTLGNTIQNSNSKQLTGQFNMTTLYNKVPYLKKINQKPPPQKPIKPEPKKKVKGSDTTKTKEEPPRFDLIENIAKIVMSVKNVSLSYSDNAGTILPGYRQSTQMFGMDSKFRGPSAGFILGQQNNFGRNHSNFAGYAAEQDWLVKTSSLNTPYTTNNSKTFNARANAEPIPGLKIEFTANQNTSKNSSQIYRWDEDLKRHIADTTAETGTYSISYLTWKTAFGKDDKDHFSEYFQTFLDNRQTVSQRLGQENIKYSQNLSINGYYNGYGATSQDVLIPAFLAAYSGRTADGIKLNPLKQMPLPNWRITYDGLSKLELVKKYFKSVTLGHAYRSSYSVGSFSYNLDYKESAGYASSTNVNGDLIPKYQISSLSISEQFSPLIKIDMTWNNSLLTNVEFKKDRNLMLTLSNNQVTEVNGKEVIIGSGYRIKEVSLPIKIGNKKLQSDLNLKADLSFRNNKTVIRKIVEKTNQATAGQNQVSIKISADYVVNERLNVRLFFDKNILNPLISSSYPSSNTNAGLSIRFTLQ